MRGEKSIWRDGGGGTRKNQQNKTVESGGTKINYGTIQPTQTLGVELKVVGRK